MRLLAIASITVLTLSCASAPPAAVATAGDQARTITGLAEYATGFFGSMKSRGTGRLEIGSAGLVWQNDGDADKNISLRAEVISRVWLTCASRPGENLCLDLGVETLTKNEYHFRDVNWEGGVNTGILEAYEQMRTSFPSVRFDRRSVDKLR